MGRVLPSRMFLSLCLSFVFNYEGFGEFSFVFLFCLGRRRKGLPQHNRASWFEVGDGYTFEKPAAAL